MTYKAAADAAAKVSLFVITVVAARRLRSADFGVFALGSTLGWMAAVVADFGIQLHLARAVARAPEAALQLLTRWLRVRLWTSAAVLVLVGLGLAAARSPIDTAGPIVAFALVYTASGLIEFLHYFYRGLSRSDIESSITIGQRVATLVCGLVALAWWPTVGALAIAMLIPVLMTLAISLRIARALGMSYVASGFSRTVDGPPDVGRRARTFRRDVAPIGAGIVLSALYFRIDVFLVQLWSGTESVALYNAVFRVIEGLRLVPAAMVAVSLPGLCRARDLRPLRNVSAGVVVGAAFVVAIAWPTAAWSVPLLFGAHYSPAVPAFRILLLSFPLLALNYALTHQLIGWDGQRAYAGICATALAANLALNARLIPALSIDGAAWATLGTELIVTGGCVMALASARRAAADDHAIVDRLTGDHALADRMIG